jgi:hypothetical protein
VRLYSRNAYDWTVRLSAIATVAKVIKAKSFTIDGEAVVLGPDGLSKFEELSRREAARTAILCVFDLIEHDGDDLRNPLFLDRKAALARLLRETEAGILLNEHIAEDGATVFAHACRLGAEGIVSKRSTAAISPARAASGSRSAMPPASPRSGSGARGRIDEPQALCAGDDGRQGGTSNPSGSINHRSSSIRCLAPKPARMRKNGRAALGCVAPCLASSACAPVRHLWRRDGVCRRRRKAEGALGCVR